MLTLQQIINEADILVPNVLTEAEKVAQLNSINQDFFNVVKIPKIAKFSAEKDQAEYTLPSDVRAKNIDLVKVGLLQYLDLKSNNVGSTQNTFSYDDDSSTLTISPKAYADVQGVVRYHRIATTTFLSSSLNKSPDAPSEYHWTYVLALASWMAVQQDDFTKATTFDNQYKAAWNAASQNYQKEG